MPKYIATVDTPWPAEAAFAFMADMTRFSEWDPGVLHAEQVVGDGPGHGAAFDVTVPGGLRPITLRYVSEEYQHGREVLLVGRGRGFLSVDRVTVTPRSEGDATVVYHADLSFAGMLGFASPLLTPVLNRIGARAGEGLHRVLTEPEPRV
jgi:hypothetical protein